MTQRYLDVNGTTLFVDDRGPADAPALVFVHGGPGMGCYDFMDTQGDRLAARLRVVGVDHRGVLRSGPVGDPPLTVRTLVEDFEAVRERLGIEEWTVLGHSAGGATALEYAVGLPQRVSGVVFDCASWDVDRTDRHRLPLVADLLDEHGEHDAAKRCRELAGMPRRLTAADETHVAMQALGEHYQDMFFHDQSARAAHEALPARLGLGDETWARGASHAPLLGHLYADRLPLLERLDVPALLVRGAYDSVTTPEMVHRFQETGAERSVQVFEGASHFPSRETPLEYARVLLDFVNKVAR